MVKADPFAHLRDRAATVVVFGDSTTEVNHWTDDRKNFVDYLAQNWHTGFRRHGMIINAGIGGDSLAGALERLDRDVLRFAPDVVIVCFGLNDCNGSTVEEFRSRYLELLRRLRAGSDAVVVLRTPNPMIDMSTGREIRELFGRPNRLGEYCAAVREIAAAESVLLVDHYAMWLATCNCRYGGEMMLVMGNPQHPNGAGHRRFYNELAPLFGLDTEFQHDWRHVVRMCEQELNQKS